MPFGEARPALLAADDRRRPVRADPGAADLDRHRHHRHPLDRRRPRPRRASWPARCCAQRRPLIIAGVVICCFALVPGLPKLPFLLIGGLLFFGGAHAGPHWPREGGPGQGRRGGGGAGKPLTDAVQRPPTRRWPSTRWSWRSASAWCRSSTSRPAARCCSASARVRKQIAAELGHVVPECASTTRSGWARTSTRSRSRAPRSRAGAHGRLPAGAGPRRRRSALPGGDDASRRSACRRCGSPTARAPRPRRRATPSSTPSRS